MKVLKQEVEKIIDDYVEKHYESAIPDMPDHKFSLRYERRKEKILCAYENALASNVYRPERKGLRKSFTVCLAAIIAAAFLALSVCAAYYLLDKFYFTSYGDEVIAQLNSNGSHPTEILEKYDFGCDMSEYTRTEINSVNGSSVHISYEKDDTVINLNQYIKDSYSAIHANPETAPGGLQVISIDGKEAYYFKTERGYIMEIDTEDYILGIVTNVSEKELIALAQSIKTVR